MVTLKDVAERAGVSPATVSYALRGGEHVSKWTSERVMQAANELGYSANVAARSLRNGRTGVIELLVRGLDLSTIYARMVTYVKHSCSDRGYRSLVMQTEQDPQTLRDALSAINSAACDGILLDSFGLSPADVYEINQNKPIVVLDDLSEKLIFDTVLMPHREGAFLATRHLIDIGCRNIALVGAPDEPDCGIDATDDAWGLHLQGFKDAMEAAGLAVGVEQLVPSNWRYFTGVDVGREMAGELACFDGLVCCNDSLAIGLIRGLADRGIRVPEGVKIVGIDGATIGEFIVPRLTTVQIDTHDLVEKGISMLVDRIDGTYTGEPRRVTANCELVVRESA